MNGISITGLVHCYPNEQRQIGFNDFKISKGSHVAILGESGRGKTTLMHLIAGMMKPTHGTIMIGETTISSLDTTELDVFRAKNIGLVFQKSHLVSSLSVIQNLQLVPYFSGLKITNQEIVSITEKLNIDDVLKKKPDQISQGQAQRVAIARAVLNRPALILADEPTSSLDDNNCQAVLDLLIEVSKSINSTLLIATHDYRVKNKINSIWQL